MMRVFVLTICLALACGACMAAYPTALVFPQDDGTFLYRITAWNQPPRDNMYVYQFWVKPGGIPGTGFAPPAWSWAGDESQYDWGTRPGEGIPPGEHLEGFGFRGEYFWESMRYVAYGEDPDTHSHTKWSGYFYPELIPEPGWGFPAAALVLSSLAVLRRRRAK